MNRIEDIAAWLRSGPGKVRIVGSGSQSQSLPPIGEAAPVSLTQLNRIVRLDAGDQTCTVECGVPRTELDAALSEKQLELPCLGKGTIGGMFASDPHGPAAAGGQGPRNLLLGIEALLADGTAFRSGARVVKSVAGFDVHKLLIGSHGRLFLAAQMHLRLKPRPRAELWFSNEGLDLQPALELLHSLRTEEQPPAVLQLQRTKDQSYSVRGRLTGRSIHINALQKRHGLAACDKLHSFHVDANQNSCGEVISGTSLPSNLSNLLLSIPDSAAFTWLGGGRFEAALPDAATTDSVLERIQHTTAAAAVMIGSADRVGHGTPLDQGEQGIAEGLKKALDPGGVLV
jgi:hypothetical protein